MTTTVNRFTTHSSATAPAGSKEQLDAVEKKYGFIPNMMGSLANSPTALAAYLSLNALLDKGTFTATERQLIALAASVENECNYCIAAHGTILKQLKHDPDEVESIRVGKDLTDSRLNALIELVRGIVKSKGRPAEEKIEAFLASGYEEHQLIELLVGVAMKTLTNYLDHLSPIEVDAAFAG